MRVEIRERTEIWLIACRAEIATVMFGRIGKVLLFCPDGIKRFCASLTPFVRVGIFVMLFEGVLVDEGAVAGVAGDAHGWWFGGQRPRGGGFECYVKEEENKWDGEEGGWGI